MSERFKVLRGTWYGLERLSATDAENIGCPGATHRLVSLKGHGTIAGRLVTARAMEHVPDSDGALGKWGVFTPHGHDSVALSGHHVST
jgi:hypothetical protein